MPLGVEVITIKYFTKGGHPCSLAGLGRQAPGLRGHKKNSLPGMLKPCDNPEYKDPSGWYGVPCHTHKLSAGLDDNMTSQRVLRAEQRQGIVFRPHLRRPSAAASPRCPLRTWAAPGPLHADRARPGFCPLVQPLQFIIVSPYLCLLFCQDYPSIPSSDILRSSCHHQPQASQDSGGNSMSRTWS